MSGVATTQSATGKIVLSVCEFNPRIRRSIDLHITDSTSFADSVQLTSDNLIVGNEINEKQKQSMINVPSRSSSNQATNTTLPSTIVATQSDTQPSPRRGSKRSLLNRSRNASRSSRRSTRQTKALESQVPTQIPQNDGARSQKKSRSGFMAMLSCCCQDDEDDLKSGVSDVPPKKTKITPTPTRTNRPGEQTDVVDIDKETESKAPFNEKAIPPIPNEDKLPMTEKAPVGNAYGLEPRDERPVGLTTKKEPISAPQPRTQQTDTSEVSKSMSTTHDQVTSPNTNLIAATPIPIIKEMPPTPEMRRDSDVEMPDAPAPAPEVSITTTNVPEVTEVPATTEVADEPVQPAEVQPQTQLPPPPPLVKRTEQRMAAEPVPEAPIEQQHWLLPPVRPQHRGRKCLILDLDETLVHSSFKILNQADFTIPVEIEGQYHNVYVIKRPGVDQFMKRVGELYEVVVFTASVSKYGDPLLDQLDIHGVVHHRLFRESCYNHQGNYVKVCYVEYS